MMTGLLGLVTMLVCAIPLCVCAVLARIDAIARQRRFGQRIFYTALTAAALFGGMILLYFFAYFARQPRPQNVGVGIAWGGVLFGCGFVFLMSALTGSIGYAISYRVFDRGPAAPEDHLIDPATRGEETGNPYQPPTI